MKTKREKVCLIFGVVAVLVLCIVFGSMTAAKTRYNDDGSYAHFTMDDSFVSVVKHPAFKGYGQLLIPASTDIGRAMFCFNSIGTISSGEWSSNQDLLDALNCMIDQANEGNVLFYDYYTEEELAADDVKGDTVLTFLKGDPGAPFILTMGGGGYKDIGLLNEGIASGVPFVEAGYNVFSFRYRAEFYLQDAEGNTDFNIAVQDVAACLEFIFEHAEEFEIATSNYAIAGFSAGGNLAQGWGTPGVGYDVFNLPAPSCVMLIYGGGIGDLGSFDGSTIPENYPPFFAISTEEDMVQIREGTKRLDLQADEFGIPHYVEIYPEGAHGFGRGTGTPAADWPEKAMKFWKSLDTEE